MILISIFFSFLISYLLSVFILPSENSNSIERISGIEISNESSSNRFELWSNALDHISNNLFISSGIGNWKIDSAAYWGSLGADYLVPYHAHNDFLHYAAELGIIGGFIYLCIFISLFYLCFLIFDLFCSCLQARLQIKPFASGIVVRAMLPILSNPTPVIVRPLLCIQRTTISSLLAVDTRDSLKNQA